MSSMRAHIEELRSLHHLPVQLGQKDAPRRGLNEQPSGIPLFGFPEQPAPLGRPSQVLADQIQQHVIFDHSAQTFQQQIVIDGGVVGSDVGSQRKPMLS